MSVRAEVEQDLEIWQRLQECAFCDRLSDWVVTAFRPGWYQNDRTDMRLFGMCSQDWREVQDGAPLEDGFEPQGAVAFAGLGEMLQEFRKRGWLKGGHWSRRSNRSQRRHPTG